MKTKIEILKSLVDKFLAWPLPQTVSADPCATDSSYKYSRIGTNLLNATEAQIMIEHLFGDYLSKLTAAEKTIAEKDAENTEIKKLYGEAKYQLELEKRIHKKTEIMRGNACHHASQLEQQLKEADEVIDAAIKSWGDYVPSPQTKAAKCIKMMRTYLAKRKGGTT